jgi:hypothetical protein
MSTSVTFSPSQPNVMRQLPVTRTVTFCPGGRYLEQRPSAPVAFCAPPRATLREGWISQDFATLTSCHHATDALLV